MARVDNGDTSAKIRREMGVTMNDYVAVFRTVEGMVTARKKLHDLKERYQRVPVQDKGRVFNTNILFVLELGFMLDCAETIVASALERKESRGAHTRTDMPERHDDDWLKHITIAWGPEEPTIDYLPVVITQWAPEARVY